MSTEPSLPRLLFSYNQVFGDQERERDNIIWRIDTNTHIWPLYRAAGLRLRDMDVDLALIDAGELLLLDAAEGRRLGRPYFCHDENLHEVRVGHDLRPRLKDIFHLPFVSLRPAGLSTIDLYAYQFPKPYWTDPYGYVIGFAVSGDHLIAHDVDMINDDDSSEFSFSTNENAAASAAAP